MHEYFAKLLPKRLLSSYKDLLKYNGIKINHEKYIGFVLLFGIGVALLLSLNIIILFSLPMVYISYIFPVFYIVFEAVIYAWLVVAADSKAKFVESVLPDALQIMAMNLKAGMTTDRALLLSARPEFGKLEEEMRKAGKRVLAGTDIKQAILGMTKGIKSRLFENTINLIVEGIESGGELSELLIRTAEDIQNKKIIEGEIQSNVMMYSMFILFAVGIGTPLLFGISTFLVETLSKQFSLFTVEVPATSGIRIGGGAINIGSGFLFMFSLLSLGITSFFGGLIIGIIRTGSEKGGMKIVPVLIAVSFTVFFIVRMLVSGIFAGFG